MNTHRWPRQHTHNAVLVGLQVLAGESKGQRLLDAHQLRKALRTTSAWQKAQLHLWHAQHGLATGGRHAVVACHGQFQTATEAGAVDGGDHRGLQVLQSLQHLLAVARQLRQLGCCAAFVLVTREAFVRSNAAPAQHSDRAVPASGCRHQPRTRRACPKSAPRRGFWSWIGARPAHPRTRCSCEC